MACLRLRSRPVKAEEIGTRRHARIWVEWTANLPPSPGLFANTNASTQSTSEPENTMARRA